ncbi:hypothetical protein PCE1_002170 [Barthelona sp. PCE]
MFFYETLDNQESQTHSKMTFRDGFVCTDFHHSIKHLNFDSTGSYMCVVGDDDKIIVYSVSVPKRRNTINLKKILDRSDIDLDLSETSIEFMDLQDEMLYFATAENDLYCYDISAKKLFFHLNVDSVIVQLAVDGDLLVIQTALTSYIYTISSRQLNTVGESLSSMRIQGCCFFDGSVVLGKPKRKLLTIDVQSYTPRQKKLQFPHSPNDAFPVEPTVEPRLLRGFEDTIYPYIEQQPVKTKKTNLGFLFVTKHRHLMYSIDASSVLVFDMDGRVYSWINLLEMGFELRNFCTSGNNLFLQTVDEQNERNIICLSIQSPARQIRLCLSPFHTPQKIDFLPIFFMYQFFGNHLASEYQLYERVKQAYDMHRSNFSEMLSTAAEIFTKEYNIFINFVAANEAMEELDEDAGDQVVYETIDFVDESLVSNVSQIWSPLDLDEFPRTSLIPSTISLASSSKTVNVVHSATPNFRNHDESDSGNITPVFTPSSRKGSVDLLQWTDIEDVFDVELSEKDHISSIENLNRPIPAAVQEEPVDREKEQISRFEEQNNMIDAEIYSIFQHHQVSVVGFHSYLADGVPLFDNALLPHTTLLDESIRRFFTTHTVLQYLNDRAHIDDIGAAITACCDLHTAFNKNDVDIEELFRYSVVKGNTEIFEALVASNIAVGESNHRKPLLPILQSLKSDEISKRDALLLCRVLDPTLILTMTQHMLPHNAELCFFELDRRGTLTHDEKKRLLKMMFAIKLSPIHTVDRELLIGAVDDNFEIVLPLLLRQSSLCEVINEIGCSAMTPNHWLIVERSLEGNITLVEVSEFLNIVPPCIGIFKELCRIFSVESVIDFIEDTQWIDVAFADDDMSILDMHMEQMETLQSNQAIAHSFGDHLWSEVDARLPDYLLRHLISPYDEDEVRIYKENPPRCSETGPKHWGRHISEDEVCIGCGQSIFIMQPIVVTKEGCCHRACFKPIID